MAFREMWTGRPGPVQLELPAPVIYATGDEARAPCSPPGAYRAPAAAGVARRRSSRRRPARAAAAPLVIAGLRRRPRRRERGAARARRAAWLPRHDVDGRARRRAARSSELRLRLRARRRPGAARGRRHPGRRLAARQPRSPLRQVLGRSGGAEGRSRSTSTRATSASRGRRAGHRRRREGRARGPRRGAAGEEARSRATRRPGALSRGGAGAGGTQHFEPVRSGAVPGIHPAHAMQVVGAVFGRDADLRHRRRQHLALGARACRRRGRART